MSSRRVVVAGLAAWLAVVTVASVLVWAVVGRVGQNLEASDEPLVASSAVAVVTPTLGHRHPHRSADSEPSSSATPSVGPSSAPPTSTATTGTAPSSPAATSTGSSSGSHSTSTTAPSGGQTGSSSQPQRRTWYGEPGLLTAECRSTSVSLVAAQPGTGYKVEIEERGPGRVLVKFEGLADGQEGEWEVASRCVGAVPAFSVSSGGD